MDRMPPVPESSAGPAGQPWPTTTTASPRRTRPRRGEPHQRLLRAARDPGPGRGRGRAAILDAGCGSGPLSAALRDRGAIVTGFDSSAGMLELARRRLGAGADLHLADLGRPLPFPDGAFDDVIASLVLHYLEDWTAPLAELRRVLRPGGRLIVSVNHPFAGPPLVRPGADYFATTNGPTNTTFSGQTHADGSGTGRCTR